MPKRLELAFVMYLFVPHWSLGIDIHKTIIGNILCKFHKERPNKSNVNITQYWLHWLIVCYICYVYVIYALNDACMGTRFKWMPEKRGWDAMVGYYLLLFPEISPARELSSVTVLLADGQVVASLLCNELIDGSRLSWTRYECDYVNSSTTLMKQFKMQ